MRSFAGRPSRCTGWGGAHTHASCSSGCGDAPYRPPAFCSPPTDPTTAPAACFKQHLQAVWVALGRRQAVCSCGHEEAALRR